MTTQQHPGGVAGRVIEQWRKETMMHTEMYSVVDGLEIMHLELSREARRILREDFDPKDRLYQYDTEVREAFELLGLDLEGDAE